MKTTTLFGLLLFAAIFAGDVWALPAATCTCTTTGLTAPDGDITSFVKRKYPGARILDRDYDDGRIEVKIRHQGIQKIAVFTRSGRWVRTVWELRRERLPKNVVSAVNRAGFPYGTIDDNDCKAVEDNEGLYYAVIAERGDDDRVFIVSSRGRILRTIHSDDMDDVIHYRFFDDGEDHFDEGDDEWDDRHRPVRRHYDDDGEDHFDEGDDEWDNRHRPVRRHYDDDDDDDRWDD